MNKQNFPALTGIRAIAAYMVYLNHFACNNPKFFSEFFFGYFYEFYISLTMFFVLSGFLITYVYYDSDKLNFKSFIQKRFARVYPMYFILTSLSFFYYSFFEEQGFKVYLLNITFLRSFFNDFVISGIAPGWSLTVEEMFYFLTPILFLFIKRNYLFLLIIPIVFLILGLGLVEFFGKYDFHGFMKDNTFMYHFTIFGRITEFVIGILLALFYKRFEANLKTKYVTHFGVFAILIGVYIMTLNKGENREAIDTLFGKFLNTLLIPLFGIAPLYWGLITEKTFLSKILSPMFFISYM
jgi:peptidoglycan/LPS O-acetylase OafA/YrhL